MIHVKTPSFEKKPPEWFPFDSTHHRQHNDQKKKYKRTNNDLQNIHIKLKIK
jgi:hypothetical protein